MRFYTPHLVPIFSHQQYQSYPTGAYWSIFWSEISRKFESSKAQRSDKERYWAVQHEVQRCHCFACFYHRICLAKLDTWHTHTAPSQKVWTNTHCGYFSNPFAKNIHHESWWGFIFITWYLMSHVILRFATIAPSFHTARPPANTLKAPTDLISRWKASPNIFNSNEELRKILDLDIPGYTPLKTNM